MALLARSTQAACMSGCHQHRRAPVCSVPYARPQPLHRQAVMAKATTGSKEEKKALTREDEPEEYWVSKGERKGANPMSDPLAIIGVAAIFLPFALLGIAIATGLVDLSVYR